MASKLSLNSPSPSTSTLALPVGRRSRRGSLASISSWPQLDKERMSQTLDQIHNAASQSETLTTFNDFTPAPSSCSGGEGKGLAGELQGGLSGLYSRFRASVGGVRDMVGAVAVGEEKRDKSISSPDSSIHNSKVKPGAVKITNVAVSSPTTGTTPTPRSQSTLASLFDNATVPSSKPSVSSSHHGGLKSPLPPLTRAVTSTAADPRLAEVHIVAVKDAASIGGSNSEPNTGSYNQEPSPRDVSLVRRDEETRKVSRSQGASQPRSDLENFQLPPSEAVSTRSSNHKRGSAHASETRHPASSDDGLSAVSQDEELLYSTTTVESQAMKGVASGDNDLLRPNGLDDSLDNLTDHQHTRDDAQSFHNSAITSKIEIAPERQISMTKERIDTASTDLPKRSSSHYTPPDPRLDNSQSTNRTPALPRISRSHLPGYTLSQASSSDNNGPGRLYTPTHTNVQNQDSGNSDEAQAVGRRQKDLPVTTNEGPPNAGNIVLSQIRSKVLSKDYWMRDENAKDCFYCGDVFSTFRRKHHCRTCGQIFDAKCTSLVSGKQFGQSGNLRVCKPCKAIINGYDYSDPSDDDTPVLDTSSKHPHKTVVPAQIHGEAGATTPADTLEQTVRPPDHRGLVTPTIAIPATRRSGGSGHQPAVLEIDAERTVARPSSSRSVRASVSGRPFSSNYKRYHSRSQHLRNFRPSVEDKAPFHGNTAHELYKGSRRSAFHNDSIIDPDLAPYLSDDASSGDEQISISAAMNSEGLSRSHDNDKSGVSGVLAAVRKGRLRFGDMSISGMTFGSRDADDTSISSSRAANPPRSARKRNISFTSHIHQRPSLRPYKGSTLPSETPQDILISPESASYRPLGTAVNGSKMTRSSSMIGAGAPAVELNNASLQHVRKLLRQLLQDSEVSKISSWERALMPILLQATDDVNPDVQNGDDLDIRHYVKLKKIPGGRPSDTAYVSGLVFTKNLALKSMPRSIACPNIVIVTFALEYARHRQHFMSLEPVIRQEREFLENLVNRIAALRPQLLLVQRNVSGLALELLERANIATAYNVKPTVIEAVSRCTQTRIISSIDKLAIKPAHAGKCSSFDLKTYVYNGRKKTYVYVSGCPKELGCTIVLRGADNDTLAKMKRITEFMVYVVYNLKLETCLMRDEFALIPSSVDGATPLARGATTKEAAIPAYSNPAPASDAVAEISNNPHEHQARLEHAAADVSNADVLSGERETFPQMEKAKNATSDDIQMPEDIPAPTFYGDMVEKHKTKILSASPFVEFMQPYLLMRAREQERRLVYLKRLRDQDSLEEQTADEKDKPQKFDLIKPEMVHATIQSASKKVREVLHALHDAEYDKALHNYQTQKRQWETYISGKINLFDPYAHQNIAVLYSVLCTVTSVPCSGPDLVALGFYNEHETEAEFEADCTLGQYVEDLCFGANTVCTANGCERKMFEHHRQYVHGEAQISVFVQNYPCRLRGMQDTIMMWSCCRVCGNETQVMPMSENTWKYSFGKYLELSFWSSHLHARADVCPHDLHRNHVRYFGFRNMAIRVQYDPINLLEIIVPRMRITWKVDNDLRLKNDLFSKTEERLNRFMASVKARIKCINTDSVVPEKAEACKHEIEKMMKRANEEHQFLTTKLQDKYMSSKYYEIIPLNRAIRATMEKVTEWDSVFEEFDSDFFPSEKDIRRLATLQLKKIFLDREGSVTTLASPREGSTTPSAGTDLSEKTSPEGSVILAPRAEELVPEKTHDMLTSVVEEHSGRSSITSNQKDSGHHDETTKAGTASKDTNSEDFLQDSSMQHVRHLDLAMPSSFPERQPGDLQRPLPESRPISPTTTRNGDPLSLEPPLNPASVRAAATFEAHQDSKSGFGVGVTSARDLASGIPRLSEVVVRRSGMTSTPPLYRAQSQPAHLRHDQSIGFDKSNTAVPPTNTLNGHVEGLGEPLASSSADSAGNGSERKVPERLGFTAKRSEKNAPRHSLIPRSVASRRKDSRVFTLAKHFEQLSREFEKERVRERRQRAAKSRLARAYPMASSKPITQVYKNVHEAVEERDPSDEDLLDDEQPHTSPFTSKSTIENMAQSIVNQTPGEGFHAEEIPAEVTETGANAQTVSLTASDAEGEGDRSDEDHTVIDDAHNPSTSAKHHTISPTEAQFDLKIELPKHERSSLVKILTNFWAERSASGWSALDYPLGPSDHVFVDSDIIVREDEPSSLIALALDCEDYQAKLESIRSHGGHPPSDYEKTSTTQLDGENLEHLDVERSLLRSTGTHLKYQFQEGSAKMACKIFFAEQFDAVRKKCGVSDRIIESLSRCLKWDSKGGKTNSVFLKTLDDRLVLKSLSQIEVQTFLSFAPAYFQIMSEALFHELPSVIAKMLGFYQIIIKNPVTGVEFNWFLLVMENLFYDRTPTRIFDLKGSMRNRKIQSTGEENEVLLDENMVEFIYENPLFAREHSKKLLRASVFNDTLFLARQNVMDYSLMIAIDENRKELVVGIIDCIRTYTWDKKLESWIKDRGFAGGGRNRPTVTSPKEYKSRFREAMARYVLQAPNCWHQFSIQQFQKRPLKIDHGMESKDGDRTEAEVEVLRI